MDLETLKDRLWRFAPDAVVITDARSEAPGPSILFVNEAFERMTGYAAAEVVGRSPRLLQGPETEAASLAALRESIRAWRPTRETVANYRKDGTPFWVDLSITPVKGPEGWPAFWLSIQRDVTESQRDHMALIETTERLRRAVLHDDLTELLNRRGLERAAEATLAAAATCGAGEAVAVIHLDLDRFKQINDGEGHAAGDAVLQEVARRLRGSLRPGDVAARIGGDEFVVLASVADPTDGPGVARRVVEALRRPVAVGGRAVRLSASAGVTVARGPSLDIDTLVIEADLALYEAKRAGRDCVRVFAEPYRTTARRRRDLGDEIREALDAGRFEPFYQPQVEARTHRLCGLEALARWRCPRRGVVPPGKFAAVAEEMDLLHRIDAAIMERVMQDRAAWLAEGLRPPRIALNVSWRRLAADELFAAVDALDPPPGALSVELTETVFLDDGSDELLVRLDRLKERGIGVEIDDFGTGHASIAGLLRIGPDRIKIDRGFVSAALADGARRRMVELIVEIGETLDVGVTAEGVHSPEHVALVEAIGCDVLQGYAFGQPEPADVVRARLPALDGAGPVPGPLRRRA